MNIIDLIQITILVVQSILFVYLIVVMIKLVNNYIKEIKNKDDIISKLKREKQRLISKVKSLQDDNENDLDITERQTDKQLSEEQLGNEFWEVMRLFCVYSDHIESILEEKRKEYGNLSLPDSSEKIIIGMINKLKKLL